MSDFEGICEISVGSDHSIHIKGNKKACREALKDIEFNEV